VRRERLRVPHLSMHSPLGDLTLFEADQAIVAIDWGWAASQEPSAFLDRVRRAMDAYFDGAALPAIATRPAYGTPYQRRVWDATCDIPAGETASYAAIARIAGGSARSVGQALGANPIPILIPCHRVVAARGEGGYSGGSGVDTKRFLLALERSSRTAIPCTSSPADWRVT
jgi:methylated-DNA-[protein]-cysteine S-methyltransferase